MWIEFLLVVCVCATDHSIHVMGATNPHLTCTCGNKHLDCSLHDCKCETISPIFPKKPNIHLQDVFPQMRITHSAEWAILASITLSSSSACCGRIPCAVNNQVLILTRAWESGSEQPQLPMVESRNMALVTPGTTELLILMFDET